MESTNASSKPPSLPEKLDALRGKTLKGYRGKISKGFSSIQFHSYSLWNSVSRVAEVLECLFTAWAGWVLRVLVDERSYQLQQVDNC